MPLHQKTSACDTLCLDKTQSASTTQSFTSSLTYKADTIPCAVFQRHRSSRTTLLYCVSARRRRRLHSATAVAAVCGGPPPPLPAERRRRRCLESAAVAA
eukprot:6174643-Pleurochrysis_carterae.AAC.1